MIIVTGSVAVRRDALEEAIRLGREHVERSRREPGCLLHSLHRDIEDPLHLVFLEHWTDRSALAAHFRVPASLAFVSALTDLVAAPPELKIYEAEEITGV